MIESQEDRDIKDALMIKTLIEGRIFNSDNVGHTLTVKGFVIANIIAARKALELCITEEAAKHKLWRRELTESDIKELVAFLKDAEASADLLEDKEWEQ